MGKITRAKDHLTIEQVKENMKTSKDTNQLRRWQIIYTALLEPRKAEEIATCVGVSLSLVQKVISQYNRFGVSSILVKYGGGRYHENLTKTREEEFLAPFFEQAKQGRHVTIKVIHIAYEKCLGKKVHKATVYRILERYEWRKICPRPSHPKADKEAQEAFKKISQL
jgi:transposase